MGIFSIRYGATSVVREVNNLTSLISTRSNLEMEFGDFIDELRTYFINLAIIDLPVEKVPVAVLFVTYKKESALKELCRN